MSSGGNNVTGHVLYPKTPETFSYDADGNLTNDLVWVYDSAREIDRMPPFDDNQRVGCCSAPGHPSWSISWAKENRLIQMTNVAAVPTVAGRKLDFVYDLHGAPGAEDRVNEQRDTPPTLCAPNEKPKYCNMRDRPLYDPFQRV